MRNHGRRSRHRFILWISILALVGFAATACGGGTASDALADREPEAEVLSDPAPQDPGDDDVLDLPDVVDGDGSVDCVEVRRALEEAGSLGSAALEGAAESPEQLEAAFDQARAQFATLGENVPELADDAAAVLTGLDRYRDVFESIDWDISDLVTSVTDLREFAELFTSTEITEMTEALTAIGQYVTEVCS